MTCLQLCVLFHFQICVNFPLVFVNIFFKIEADPVEMRCQCLYSAIMHGELETELLMFPVHLVL